MKKKASSFGVISSCRFHDKDERHCFSVLLLGTVPLSH